MHLINTKTLCLEEFSSEEGIDYAILSHRWGKDETTFRDMQSLETAKERKGFSKIEKSCRVAAQRGHQYMWIDTCCINKESTAELSEAINSMFRWYQNAAECYTYLFDVEGGGEKVLDEFKSSEWFERGWTLQELLAPKDVYFFNKSWEIFGSKKTLGKKIHDATGIPKKALRGKNVLRFSIAQRMSWAALRKTTRAEDRAYSLMGLFNVNMPMLYGEGGEKAFMRLQEEIIKTSTDHSVFAWKGVGVFGSGLLATLPNSFAQSAQFLYQPNDRGLEPDAFSVTNRGLHISLAMTPWASSTYLAFLNCGDNFGSRTGIFLKKLSDGQYHRVQPNGSPDIVDARALLADEWYTRQTKRQSIYVRQNRLASSLPRALVTQTPLIHGLRIISNVSEVDVTKHVSAVGHWDSASSIATLHPGQHGEVATIDLQEEKKGHFAVIKLGLDFYFQPRVVVAGRRHSRRMRTSVAYGFDSKFIWDIDFNEDAWEALSGSSDPISTPILPVWRVPKPTGEILDTDIWAFKVPSDFSKLQQWQLRRVGGKRLGSIAFLRESHGASYVWKVGISITDIEEEEPEQRSSNSESVNGIPKE